MRPGTIVAALGTVWLLAMACDTEEIVNAQTQPTMLGSWKFVSFVLSNCNDETGNREEVCQATATDCGVFSLTESSWTWEQTLPDGSPYTETGTYTISSNVFIVLDTSGSRAKILSLTGSAYSYTQTTLTFVNTSVSTGCTHTVTYVRHFQPSPARS